MRSLKAKPLLFRRFLRLAAELHDFTGGRLILVAILAAVAAAAEGIGILLLVPLLASLGPSLGPSLGENGPAALPSILGLPLPALRLEWILGAYVLLVSAAAAVLAWRQLVSARLRIDFIRHLRRRLHAAILGMEWGRFSRQRGAALTHTLIQDVDQADLAVEFLLILAGTSMQLLSGLAVALALSPWAVLLCLGAVLAAAPLGWVLDRRLYRLGQETGWAWQELQATVGEDVSSFRLIKAFDLTATRERMFDARLEMVNDRELHWRRMMAAVAVARRVVAASAAAGIVLLLVRGFGMALPETLAVMVAMARVLMVTGRLADGWRSVVHALPAHARARALLSRARNAAEPPADERVEPPAGDIAIAHVTLRHAPDRPPALLDVSAHIPHRSLTVLVGPSGSGKSTLGDLLLGLVEPDQGEIRVGGRPLRGAVRRAWRRRVAMVPQDPVLFHDTIRANLMLAGDDMTEADLWAALADAGAADFVRRLPAGLETVVGERGAALSGGERQRLALARALLRRPDMLVLDEPTSALDGAGETHVLATLQALRRRMTILLISHRPVPGGHADLLLRLDQGTIQPGGAPRSAVSDTLRSRSV